MNELHKKWLKSLYEDEIEEVRAALKDEHLWELGYDGEEENPHTENIKNLSEYIGVLNHLIAKLESN